MQSFEEQMCERMTERAECCTSQSCSHSSAICFQPQGVVVSGYATAWKGPESELEANLCRTCIAWSLLLLSQRGLKAIMELSTLQESSVKYWALLHTRGKT